MRKFGFAFLAVFLLATSALLAQQEIGLRATPLQPSRRGPKIYIGPVFGYNNTLHSGTFASVPGPEGALCPTFTDGTLNGYYVGLSFEYLLGKPRESKSSIIGRIVYNTFPASFTKDGETLPSLDPNDSSKVYLSTTNHTADIEYSTLDLEIIYKLNLFNSNFGIVIGPTIGTVMNVQRTQRMNLLTPENATFKPKDGVTYENFGRTILVGQDELPGHNALRLAIKAGAQYEITVGRVLVVPCIYYNFGVTKLSDADNLRVNALQIGCDLRFAL